MPVDYSKFQLGVNFGPLSQALQHGFDQRLLNQQFQQKLAADAAAAEQTARNKIGNTGAGGGWVYDEVNDVWGIAQPVQQQDGTYKTQIEYIPGVTPQNITSKQVGGDIAKDLEAYKQMNRTETLVKQFNLDVDKAKILAGLEKDKDLYSKQVESWYAEEIAKNSAFGKASGEIASMRDLALATGDKVITEKVLEQTYDAAEMAAKRIPVLNRVAELYDKQMIPSGMPEKFYQSLARYMGGEDAAQKELGNLLDQEALTSLRAIYGSQFTQVDREVLQDILAGFGKNPESNKALLINESRKAEADYMAGLRYAQDNPVAYDRLKTLGGVVFGTGSVGVDTSKIPVVAPSPATSAPQAAPPAVKPPSEIVVEW